MLLARLRLRSKHLKVVSFTRALSDARRTLLIMPLTSDTIAPVRAVLDLLHSRLEGRSLTIVTTAAEHETTRMFPDSHIVRIGADDISAFYLPRRAALDRTFEKPFDLAIDLNLDFVLPSAYICRESNARVRVGFLRKRAESFYNFTLHPDPASTHQGMYDRLAQCLKMF
jgi:hypothetical protein